MCHACAPRATRAPRVSCVLTPNPNPNQNPQLRLIVTGARESGSIETSEGDMIQGVLDLQDQKIKEIMRPRVEMIAVPQVSLTQYQSNLSLSLRSP